jgi:hypothetical protein
MDFCDLNCVHAEWPEDESLDGSGSCRTFQAIYCKKKKRHVHKNMPCPEKSKPKDLKNVGIRPSPSCS